MVFLYAGQGAQRPGMGKDFYDSEESFRKLLDSLEEAFPPLRKMMFEAPAEELSLTRNTQPCMAAFQAGVTALLLEKGITPEASCGLSLGEYGALFAAGVMDAKTFVELVAYRGKVMAEASEGLECAMSAILGAEISVIEEVTAQCADAGFVVPTNYNCPGQTVICGDEAAVTKAEELLKERGAKRAKRLKVSGPFHTKYMEKAGELLREYLVNVTFADPKLPVISNVKGDFYSDGDDIKALLVRQIQESVKLEQGLRILLEKGHRDFLEIGPGNTMAGFLKKTAKAMNLEINVKSIDSLEDFKTL